VIFNLVVRGYVDWLRSLYSMFEDIMLFNGRLHYRRIMCFDGSTGLQELNIHGHAGEENPLLNLAASYRLV
jgi:hypothetical protein